jgi:hypothetical protein
VRPRRTHIEITERSVTLDGKDISHLVHTIDVTVGVNRAPTVWLGCHAYFVTADLDASVYGIPFDGIARLRARLG